MKKNILIIDDDQNFIKSMKVLLDPEYNIAFANDASNGLNIIKSSNPDVVLLDLILKNGENGIQILKEIKQLDRNLPIIMITGHSSVETAVKAIQLGASDYISKTPNLKKLE